MGGRTLLGRLPGLDDLFARVAGDLEKRLNRASRPELDLRIRGVIVLAAFLPLLYGAGLLLNRMAMSGSNGFAAATVLLALTLRQRHGWDAVLADARKSAASATSQSDSAFLAARRGAERLVFTFAETVVAGAVLFGLGGFSFLLPFQFAAALISVGAAGGTTGPKGPFFMLVRPVYTLASLPAALIAALALAVSPIAIPASRADAIKGLRTPPKGRLPLRLWPLAVVAEALALAFDGSLHGSKHKAAHRWIGPKDGRARLTALDIARVGRMVLIAEAVLLLLVMMLSTALLSGA